MTRGTDGPTPRPLTPGLVYLDGQQSLAECVETAWLLEAWLTSGCQTEQDSPPPSCIDRGGSHATD